MATGHHSFLWPQATGHHSLLWSQDTTVYCDHRTPQFIVATGHMRPASAPITRRGSIICNQVTETVGVITVELHEQDIP